MNLAPDTWQHALPIVAVLAFTLGSAAAWLEQHLPHARHDSRKATR